VGLPAGFDAKADAGYDARLLNGLARQLGASLMSDTPVGGGHRHAVTLT
jgi:hypothetical protein